MATFFCNFITIFSLLFTIINSSSTSSESDILLSFKSTIKDPSNFLASWSNTSLSHYCNWTGIICSNNSPSVTSINLQSFNLSGELSPVICQLPSLSSFNLADNLFNQPIPLHFSDCDSLVSLNLSSNLIWGTIPEQISQFSSLEEIDFSKNHIEGKIPENIGLLKKLQVLNFGNNLLSGNLPGVFGNFSNLVVLDLSENPFLVSKIPSEIGDLKRLEQILLQNSGFFGDFPETFLGLSSLKVLDLSQNNLTGELPKKLGASFVNLVSFDVSVNKLSGPFPNGICSGKTLTSLSLHTNHFTGLLPESVNQCINLERFQVQNNGFSGNFPNGLWSLPKIMLIRGENNRFSGEIPEIISTAIKLEQVQIDNNSFTGSIPKGLGSVKSLYRFSASNNHLFGGLPHNFCDSPVMSIINLSQNLLSGKIPEVKKCRKLVSLSLADNSFVGEIPHSLGQLPVLTYLDLSGNNLTGSIPEELQNLKLALFNVSYNRLSGRVPFLLVTGLPASYLQGNPGLCGPGLPKSCSDEGEKHRNAGLTRMGYALVSVALASAVIMAVFALFLIHRRAKNKSEMGVWHSVFFYPLRISEQDLVMSINEKTAVGSGGTFGTVHIISLPSSELIAVKKLVNSGSQSTKSLKGEIKTLAKIRHKNIVKILGFCCTEDSIFLIYEYLSKGSLGDILGRPNLQMQWNVRLRIAIGVAQGLAYLHNDYSPHLLHRDVKSANILLDADFEPKITDFALDRIVGDSLFQSTLSFESPFSCHVAPECKYNKKATEQMDVYNFGVVLLELVTGRQAAGLIDSEESSLDIVKWVRRKINIANGSDHVLDPRISVTSKEEMLGALDLGIQCTSVMPEKRPSMTEVVRALQTLGSKSSSRRLPFTSSSSTDGSLPV
ncbi:probably inactive leucine-rich repeat receptor-like protein kinase At5g06940 [Chenopodium quinoa]|uniref:probably inactive leucine-rich repeat receptor-like protein kinase At5g06940 n=1 Tax=Chenopodium quinoa TaxID=63459 RepID=UPI000B78D217|nr:probably inactive leucine-rich repeat receptor-like protein kinase At5g06940 [Chenopodium quinoa]